MSDGSKKSNSSEYTYSNGFNRKLIKQCAAIFVVPRKCMRNSSISQPHSILRENGGGASS